MRRDPPGGNSASGDGPLTEVVLARLRGPRWLWIALWSLVALVSPLVFIGATAISGRPITPRDVVDLFAMQAAIAFACFVLLAGTRPLARQARAVRLDIAGLVAAGGDGRLFGATASVWGPLVLTAIVVAIATAGSWVTYGPLPPLAVLPLLIIYIAPIMTFTWVYLVILIDLDRLGRQPLTLDRFPQDRALGLRPVGALASSGLGLVLIAAVPVLLVTGARPVTLGIGLAIVAVTVAVFILSMWRLHRQMAAAKARYVEIAERLYADAYAPIREQTDLERLAAQATPLGAAQSLADRAHSLLTWPVDEGTLRFIAVVVTGVVTSLVVRALFAAVGF